MFIRDISIYYNNGTDWVRLGDYTVTRAPGTVNMPCNLTVEFNGVSATSVVVLAKSVNGNWGDPSYVGFSEVRFGQFNTIANDTDNYVRYGLGWTYQDGKSSGDYNSDVHYCMQNGSYFEYTFTGTNVSYIGPKNIDYGTVDVYIDGVYMTTVDCYSPSYQAQQVLYSIAGLSNRMHVLKGVKTGGTYVCTDKFVAN